MRYEIEIARALDEEGSGLCEEKSGKIKSKNKGEREARDMLEGMHEKRYNDYRIDRRSCKRLKAMKKWNPELK